MKAIHFRVTFSLLALSLLATFVRAEETRAAAPPSTNTAIVPVSKLEIDGYDWFARHEAVLETKKTLNPEIVLIGDSITHFWSGEPIAKIRNGVEAWKLAFGGKRVLNMGFGWDRTQNVLWRIEHGEFDGLHPRFIILNIGTNNFTTTKNAKENTPAQVAEAIGVICDRLRAKSPKSAIIVMGVFPRGQKADNPYRAKISALNALLKPWAAKADVAFVDIGVKMLDADGSIPRDIMRDFCHPSEKGYAIWAEAVKPLIEK